MFTKKTLLCALAAAVIGAGQAVAYEDQKEHHDESEAGHSHEMSEVHGGHVTMTPMHHFEVMFLSNEARVYLYDKEQKVLAVPKDVSVSMVLQTKSGETTTLPLKYAAPDPEKGRVQGYFSATHDFASIPEGSMKALVQVSGLAKKPIEFKTDVALSEAASYVCPMKDSPPAMDPMKCPKCGMQMVRQPMGEEHESHEHSDHGGHH